MSFAALAAVSRMRAGSAAEKLVALAYADRHNEESGCAYPSLAWLCEFSSLNRKTVIAAVIRLEQAGFLTDTGERQGNTRQIKVYRLNLESIPKAEPYQKRNGTKAGTVPKTASEQSQKRDTDTVMEPISPTVSTKPTESDAQTARLSVDEFEEGWKTLAAELGLPTIRGKLTGKRRQAFIARSRDHPVQDWVEAFDRIRRSPFLRGETGNWAGANVSFLLRPDSITKILEGNYDRTTH